MGQSTIETDLVNDLHEAFDLFVILSLQWMD